MPNSILTALRWAKIFNKPELLHLWTFSFKISK